MNDALNLSWFELNYFVYNNPNSYFILLNFRYVIYSHINGFTHFEGLNGKFVLWRRFQMRRIILNFEFWILKFETWRQDQIWRCLFVAKQRCDHFWCELWQLKPHLSTFPFITKKTHFFRPNINFTFVWKWQMLTRHIKYSGFIAKLVPY